MDLELIRTLVRLMNDNDLSELEVDDGGTKVRLAKGRKVGEPQQVVAVPQAMPMPMAMPMGAPAGSLAAAAVAPAAPALDPSTHREVPSPLVGTFYRSANPGAPPFVEDGQAVTEDTVLGLVEAMKVFNEIKAECAGVIEEMLIDNGEAVEYGQALCRIRLAD